MTKIIWIDLDEVLWETLDKVLLDNNYKIWEITVSKDDFIDYNFTNLNVSIQEWNEYFHRTFLNDKKLDIEVVKWAKEKIEYFKNKWYKLKIVTARPENFEEYTKKWVSKNFPNTFESIHFANHFSSPEKWFIKKKKSEICLEIWIKIMVDDVFDYAFDLASNWIYTFLLEKPWNRHIEIEHPNIKKVKHWWEINI